MKVVLGTERALPESRLAHGLAYVLIAVAPLTVFEELGLPITHGILPLYVTPVVELSDVPALGLLLVAAWRCWRERHAGKARRRIFPLRLTGPLLILASLGLVSSPWALSPPFAYFSTMRWFLSAGVAWALVRVGPSPRRLAIALLLALVPQALIGIGQAVAQRALGLPIEPQLSPGQPGAPIIPLPWGHWLRAYGLTFHPNVLGGFLAVGVLTSVPLLVRPWVHPLWWILWGGLLVTFSRSAWLAVSLMLPVVLVWLYARSPALRRTIVRTSVVYGVVMFAVGCVLANQIAA